MEKHEVNPVEMEDEYLVELAFQLYARACQLDCTEQLHIRAMELKGEVYRRIKRGNLFIERSSLEKASVLGK